MLVERLLAPKPSEMVLRAALGTLACRKHEHERMTSEAIAADDASDRLQNDLIEELIARAVGPMLDRQVEPWRLVLALAAIGRVLAGQAEEPARLAPVIRSLADELEAQAAPDEPRRGNIQVAATATATRARS